MAKKEEKSGCVEYTIKLNEDEDALVKEKAKKERVTPEEHIKAAALNNGRKRMKDKVTKIMANQALSYCNELISITDNNNPEMLGIMMRLKGTVTGIC